jgi:phosphopantothenoylcysteine synthetase/decarboxylase
VTTLKGRGAQFIGPEEGLLSCGYEGLGRLWPVDQVAGKAWELLQEK